MLGLDQNHKYTDEEGRDVSRNENQTKRNESNEQHMITLKKLHQLLWIFEFGSAIRL